MSKISSFSSKATCITVLNGRSYSRHGILRITFGRLRILLSQRFAALVATLFARPAISCMLLNRRDFAVSNLVCETTALYRACVQKIEVKEVLFQEQVRHEVPHM
jgi:hypothetical protein